MLAKFRSHYLDLNQVKGLKKDLGQYEVLRNIVSDADKLEAIGEAGVLRCYQYQAEVHPHLSTEQVSCLLFLSLSVRYQRAKLFKFL